MILVSKTRYSDPSKTTFSKLFFFPFFLFFIETEDGQLTPMETDRASSGPTSVNSIQEK